MAQKEKHILIVCGEASGELNAANLVKALKVIDPKLKVSAVGASLLRNAGAEVFCDIKDLSVMGLFDVLKKLPRFLALKKQILNKIASEKPDAIILVDFSGFNLRLAKAINKQIPVIYYISPQVWASRQGRIKTIKKYISKIIVIFKFEQEFYHRHGIDVECVGHPLLDIVMPSMNRREFLETFNLSFNKTTISLLPGSRKQEIKLILPVMLEAARIIKKKSPGTQFIIAKTAHLNIDAYYNIIRKFDIEVKVIENKTYDCLNVSDFCLVCSGTATVETAIMKKPFFVVYKMNPLNYLLYRPQVKIPYIGMANIVAGREIVPEFIQSRANGKDIAQAALNLLESPERLERMQQEISSIKEILGERGASLRAAKIITDFLFKH